MLVAAALAAGLPLLVLGGQELGDWWSVASPASTASSPPTSAPRTTSEPSPAEPSEFPPAPIPTIGAGGAWEPEDGPVLPVPPPPAASRSERPAAPSPTPVPQPVPTPVPTPPAATPVPTPVPAPPAATGLGIFELVNRARAEAGCGPVSLDPVLQRQAQAHAERQAQDDRMFHSDDDVAENVAAGYETAASVHEGWMNSPGHRANILDCDAGFIGVGVADSADGTRYWTEQFGAGS